MDLSVYWLAMVMPIMSYVCITAISGTQEDGRKFFCILAALANVLYLTGFMGMLSEGKHRG